MRIVVLGAGTVGSSIADLLCRHGHSVIVVDSDPERTRALNDELDVRTVTGSASQSSVLFQAGVLGADLCLAVTGTDEVNMVAASMAKAMGSRRSIARAYAPVFRDLSTFDYRGHFQIDRLLSLEHLSAMEMARGIRSPGSLTVESLAEGHLEVHEFTAEDRTEAVGRPLRDLRLPKGVRVGSLLRGGTTWIAGAEDQIEIGDRVTLIGRHEDIDRVRKIFRSTQERKRSVVIAGGGETGYHLARFLSGRHYHVTLMETNPDRCEKIANNLPQVTVVRADATRRVVLEEERVSKVDVFAACTGDDENNIMACVEARDIGARTIVSIVGRPDYAAVVGKLGIDLAVSPRNVIAKQVMAFLTAGPVISRTTLADSSIEVLEIEVQHDMIATQHVLANLPLPSQFLIVAVIRQDYVQVPGADDRLQAGDVVVALAATSVVDAALAIFDHPPGR